MSRLLLVLLVAFVYINAAYAEDQLPEKFYGRYEMDRSENLDAYLTEKGYSWFTRKLVLFAKFKKIFGKTSSPTMFDFSNLSTSKDTHYKNIVLGKPFEARGLDDFNNKVEFTLKNGRLYEHHIPIEDKNATEETYEYYFEGDVLVLHMEHNNVAAKMYFNRSSA